VKKILPFAALFAAQLALAGCNSEASEPAPVETPAPVAAPTPTLPAPNEDIFAQAYAQACPDAEPVSTSICRSKGFGAEGFICDYGLGNDEYRRHKAELAPGDGEWLIADAEAACAAE
jgi:hypothetical protein